MCLASSKPSYVGLAWVFVLATIAYSVDVDAVCSPTVSLLLSHTGMIASGC